MIACLHTGREWIAGHPDGNCLNLALLALLPSSSQAKITPQQETL